MLRHFLSNARSLFSGNNKYTFSPSVNALRNNENGNIFFMLFGAVAVVGTLGAVTVSTMRGPLSTMVEVQARTKAESEMAIASRLAMLEATELANSGDCDGDGFVEPLEYRTGGGPTGGGLLPSSISSSRIDPWGTEYGYCVWDGGTTINDTINCDNNGTAGLQILDGDGSAGESYTIIAIISAGEDQVFQTTCTEGPPSLNKGGDDIVSEFTYAAAAVATDGLWNLKSGDPDTAQIAKNLEIDGSASFSGGIDLRSSTSALTLGAASMLFPTDTTPGMGNGDCNAANHGLLRVNTATDPDTLEICDSATGWSNVGSGGSIWSQNTGNEIFFDSAGTTEVGIGTNAPTRTLDIVGTLGVSGSVFLGNDLDVSGTSTFDDVEVTTLNASDAVDFNSTLNVDGTSTLADVNANATTVTTLGATGAVDFDTTLNVDGTSTLADVNANATTVTTLGASGAVNLDDELNVDGETTLTGTLNAQASIFNGTGNVNIADDLDVRGNYTSNTGNITLTDGTVEADNYTWNGNDFTPSTCASGNFNRWDGNSWVCESDTAGGGGGGAIQENLSDDDGDTLIQLEETVDDDTIRFDTAGSQRVTIGPTGDVDMRGDGTSLNIDLNNSSGYPTLTSTATHIRLVENIVVDQRTFQITDSGNDRRTTMSHLNNTDFRMTTSQGSIFLQPAENVGIGNFTSDTIDSTLHIQTGDIRLDGGADNQAGCIRYVEGTGLQFSDDCSTFTAFSDVTGTPGGSSTQIQYNDGGSFGGDSGLTYDDINNTLTVDGAVVINGQTGDAPNFANIEDLDNVTISGIADEQCLKYNTTTSNWENGSCAAGVSSDTLSDADGDTQIQVEESADDDTIRFDTAGSERMTIDNTGLTTINGNLNINNGVSSQIDVDVGGANATPILFSNSGSNRSIGINWDSFGSISGFKGTSSTNETMNMSLGGDHELIVTNAAAYDNTSTPSFTFEYTANKATTGNDTGILIAKTDVASPGVSLLLDGQTDGVSYYNIGDSGDVYMNGTLTIDGGTGNDAGCIRFDDTTDQLQFSHDCSTFTTMAGAGGGIWTDNTTHITRENFHILDAGATMTTAGFDNTIGSAFVWHPDKRALRAGSSGGGTKWNESEIGANSFVMGDNSRATNNHSFAFGSYVDVTGEYSIGMGNQADVFADGSSSIGRQLTVNGTWSHARGNRADVSGNNSWAFGLGNAAGTYPIVSGDSSFGIFMGDQSGYDLTTANRMALVGGDFLIDDDGTAGSQGCIRYVEGTGLQFSHDCSTFTTMGGVASGTVAINDLSDGKADYATAYSIYLGEGSGANVASLGDTIHTIGLGYNSLNALTSGDRSIAIGTRALSSITSADNNIAIGYQAGDSVTGSSNIVIGNDADVPLPAGSNQLVIGSLLTGTMNSGLLTVNGTGALTVPTGTTAERPSATNGMIRYNTTDAKFEMYQSGSWTNLGTASVLNDLSDGATDYTTLHNMFIGDGAGASITTGSSNIAIGEDALTALEDGNQNVAFGYGALTAVTAGTGNIGIGRSAAGSITSALSNIAIGTGSLGNITTEHRNIGIGNYTLSNSTASHSIAIGRSAGNFHRSGHDNIFIGTYTAVGESVNYTYTGSDNVIIGTETAMDLDEDNDQNTIIGSKAAASLTGGGNRNILLGYATDVQTATTSDHLNIGNLIYGDLANEHFIIGSYQLDDTGTGTEDNRLYFNKAKGAFRAGTTDISSWNDANVGSYSFGLGERGVASGIQSGTWGYDNTASGGRATAWGYNSTASGTESTAWGGAAAGSIAGPIASGAGSTAWGIQVESAGLRSVAVGLLDAEQTTDPVVSGDRSYGVFMGTGADILSGYNLSTDDTFGIIGGTLMVDDALAGSQGCIRYVEGTGLQFSHDCSTYTNMGTASLSWPLAAPDGTEAAPSYAFANSTGSGLYYTGTNMHMTTTEGSLYFDVDTDNNNGTDRWVWRTPNHTYVNKMTLSGTTLNIGEDQGSDINGLDIRGWSGDQGIIITNNFSGDGDAIIKMELTEDTPLITMGLDDSDADRFKISGGALDTNDRITIETTGEIGLGDFTGDTIDSALHILTGDIRLDGGIGNEAGCIRFDDTSDVLQFSHDCSSFTSFSGGSSLWTDNTTHITRENFHILDNGQTMTSASLENANVPGIVWHTDKYAFRGGQSSTFGAWNETNIGNSSFAFGDGSRATGNNSVSFGQASQATGNFSFAAGDQSVAGGTYAIAMGTSTTSGVGAVALGQSNSASANNAVAIGEDANVTGDNSFAFGLGDAATTAPVVSGANSFGIFMGDQSGIDISDANTFSIMGASGGVGIGRTGPDANLHVDGSNTSMIRATSGGAQRFLVDNDSGDTRLRLFTGAQSSTVYIESGKAGSPGTSYLSNSTFGIGTSSPTDILTIVGDGEDIHHYSYSATANRKPDWYAFRARGTESSPTAVQNGDELGGIGVSGYDGNSFERRGQIWFEVNGSVSDGNVPTDIVFVADDAAYGTERMRLTHDGNLGIGTSSPTDILTIVGNGEDIEHYSYSATANYKPDWYGYRARGTEASPSTVQDGDLLAGIGGYGYDGNSFDMRGQIWFEVNGTVSDGDIPTDIVFIADDTTSGTERMRLTHDGNLGIGTQNPNMYGTDRALTVSGNNGVSGSTAAIEIEGLQTGSNGNYAALLMFNGSSNGVGLTGRRFGADNSAALLFSTSNAGTFTEKMRLSPEGYLGIGDDTPNVALDVAGDIEYTGTITDVSDMRLKDNVKPLNKKGKLLERINQIETYSFTMKGDEKSRIEYGVMAQELEDIFPTLVHTADDEMGTKSVNYVGLVAPMIEATKELKAENDSLKSQMDDLSQQVALLNKMAGNNVDKASMRDFILLLFGLFCGMALMVGLQRRNNG